MNIGEHLFDNYFLKFQLLWEILILFDTYHYKILLFCGKQILLILSRNFKKISIWGKKPFSASDFRNTPKRSVSDKTIMVNNRLYFKRKQETAHFETIPLLSSLQKKKTLCGEKQVLVSENTPEPNFSLTAVLACLRSLSILLKLIERRFIVIAALV